MKSKIICLLLLIAITACSTGKGSVGNVADDYGYSQQNPIKVGGGNQGPAMERKYLNRLTGPNGEIVTYQRSGSCCHFDTSNGFMGMGMLDIYIVKIAGDTVSKKLYLNMYDSGRLYAPKGFLLK